MLWIHSRCDKSVISDLLHFYIQAELSTGCDTHLRPGTLLLWASYTQPPRYWGTYLLISSIVDVCPNDKGQIQYLAQDLLLSHAYKHAKPTWTNGNWAYFFLMSVVLRFFALAHVVALVSSQDTRSASCVLASYHWVPLWLCTVSHILIHNDRRSTLQARVPVMWRRRY